jgi:hypothetical protein
MTTRIIVTSQPDVACYVCERRLLRGEAPEIFLVDGHPRTVCELCAPRAAHEGWLRESDGDRVSLPPVRTRRGRNLFGRLRHVGRPLPEHADSTAATATPTATATRRLYDDHPESYDFLGGSGPLVSEHAAAVPAEGRAPAPSPGSAQAHRGHAHPVAAESSAAAAPPAGPVDEAVERAIEVFNAGEYPRRVAGVARSLGVPGVSVHAVEDGGNAVVIVVAWELCWYRYAVDFDLEPVEARCIAQGTELMQLPQEDRLANADVNDAGSLSLSAPG